MTLVMSPQVNARLFISAVYFEPNTFAKRGRCKYWQCRGIPGEWSSKQTMVFLCCINACCTLVILHVFVTTLAQLACVLQHNICPYIHGTCHFSAEMLTKSKRISFCQVSGLVGTDTLQRDDIYRFPHLRCSMQAVMLTDNEMVFALRYLMPSTPTVIHVLATCLSSVRPHMVLNFGQYIQSAHATFDPFIAEVCHPGNQTPGCVRSTALAPANTQ